MTPTEGGPPLPSRRAALLTLAVFAATFATHAAATLRAGAFDDAYITYTFARNVAAGHGFVWSPGEAPLYGSSTVPYVFLLAALDRLGASIPAASLAIGCLGWAAANALLFRSFLAPWGTGPALAAAALNALSLRAVQSSLGMETGLYVLLVCAAFSAYGSDRLRLAGLLSGAVVAMRLDGALVPLLLTAHALVSTPGPWSGRLRRAASVALPALLVIVPVALALLAYFGSVVPHTLLAKTQGMALAPPFSPHTVLQALTGQRRGADPVLPAVMLGLGFTGILLGALRGRVPHNLVFAWGAAYVALFCAARIPESPWYAAALLPVLHQGVVGATRALSAALRRVAPRRGGLAHVLWLPVAAQLLVAAVATARAVHVDPLGATSGSSEEHRQLAEIVREDMRARGKTSASVIAFEVGYLGYLVPGRVHDVLGLVSPEVVALGPLAGPPELLRRYQPEYAVLVDARLAPPLSPLVESRAFRELYEVIASHPTAHGADYQVLRREPRRWRTTWTSPEMQVTVNAGTVRLAVPDVPQEAALICLQTRSLAAGPIFTTLDRGAGDEPATQFPFWIAAGEQAVCRPGGFSGPLRAVSVEAHTGRAPLTVTGLSVLAAQNDSSPGGRLRMCLESPTLGLAGPVSGALGLDHVAIAGGTFSAHPPSGFVLRVRNAGRPVVVRFTAALVPETPPTLSDGVTFVVATGGRPLFERHVPVAPAYSESTVAVPGSEGQAEVLLAFSTTPGPSNDTGWDWAEWRHLQVEVGGTPLPLPADCPEPQR